MKKFMTILLISCSSLLLTGCFGGDETEVAIDSSYNNQSFVGYVEELPESSTSINATHVLKTDTGDTVYLRSVLFDLEEFVDSKLRVSGTMEEKEDGTKVLLVESRDVLELNSSSDEPIIFEFEEKGFEIELPESKFEISESNSLVNFVADEYSFTVKPVVKGLELDLEIYLDENYGDQIPQDVLSANSDRYSKLNLGVGRTVYIHNTEDVIYEIIFNSDGTNQAEMNLEINSVLDNIFYTPETIDNETTVEIDDNVDQDDSTNEDNNSGDDNSTQQPPASVDSTSLTSEVSEIVANINANKASLLSNDARIFKYSITDNGYTYVSYTNSDEDEFRKLFRINGDQLEEVAYFEEGSETDWELVSGDNLAYDRPLKMVFVEDNVYRQVDVKEGYRYFESRPMLLGFHYPREWYYAGGNNEYSFSDKPLTEGETLVKVELLDEGFSSLSGSAVSPTIKKATVGSDIVYYVEKENGDVISLRASNEYSEELDIMAQTLIEVSE